MKRTKRFMAMLLMFLLCAGEIGSTGINVFAAGDPVKGTGTIPDVVQEAETVSGDTALDETIEADAVSGDEALDETIEAEAVSGDASLNEAKEAETAAGGSRYRLVLLEGCKAYEDVNRLREIPSGSMIDIPSMIYFYAPSLPRQEFDQWFFATGKGDDPAIDDSLRFAMKNSGRVSSMKKTFISAVFDSFVMDLFKDMDTIYAESMYKDATGPFVDKVSVNVTTPKSGEAPDYDVTTDSEECKIYTIHWIDAESGKYLKESDTFAAGKVYEAEVWLDEKDGYTIDALTNVYINGHKATYKDRIRGSSIFFYNFRVDVVNVTVTEPVIGTNPDFTASTDSTICTISLNEVAWIDVDSGRILDTTDQFEVGHTYRAVVWLDPIDGNSITSETEVYINGKKAERSNAGGSSVQYICNFKLAEPGYDLWVGGKRVTDSNKNDILGDDMTSFDPSTNSLILKNLSGTIGLTNDRNGNSVAIYYEGTEDLTITGTADLSSNTGDFAVESHIGKLTFKDADLELKGNAVAVSADDLVFDGGKLKAVSAYESEGCAAIAARDIIINKGKIETEIEGQLADGVHADTLTVNGGLLNVNSYGASCTGIYVEKSLVLNNGEISATASAMDDWTCGICGKNDGTTTLTVNGGKLYGSGSYSGIDYFNGGITLADGVEILVPEGGKLNDAKTKVVDQNGSTPAEVVLSADFSIYTVTFSLNGQPGTPPIAQNVKERNTAKIPETPAAKGYTFNGWYTDKACTKEYVFTTPVMSDLTLYAGWTKTKTPAPEPKPLKGGKSALDPVPDFMPGKTTELYLVKGQKFDIGQGWYIDKNDKVSKKLVSISKKGIFKAKAEGDAIIKSGTGAAASEVKIHISTPKMSNKSLTIETETATDCKTEQIPLVYDSVHLDVYWYSANPDVVTVDDLGNVTSVGKGSSVVTAYINGSAYKCKVTVKEKVALQNHTIHLAKGTSKSISIKGLKNPEWTPSDPGIVTVKKNKITGDAAGDTVLSFTQNETKYKEFVIVEDIGMSGTGLKENGRAGSNKYLIDENAGYETKLSFTHATQPVVFKSNKPDIAFIDEDLNVVMRGTGKAAFTAKVDGKTITITVNVK